MKQIKTMIVIGKNTSPSALAHATFIAQSLGLKMGRCNFKSYNYESYIRWDGHEMASGPGTAFDSAFNQPTIKEQDVIIDLRQYNVSPPLRLNDKYTAVIEGEEVVVGCQRFPKSKVLELAELLKE